MHVMNCCFILPAVMHGSRNFFQGGPGLAARLLSGQRFLFFLVLNLFYSLQRWFYYRENYTFPRIQRGSNIFQGGGGGPTFSRGVQMLISIEPL